MRSVRSLKRRSELRRSRSVDSVYRRETDQRNLVRVSSDPHLSIPRASLTRSRTDLNNNQKVGGTVIEKRYSSSSLSSPSVRSPGAVIMTREQIIDMFACPDSPGY